MKEKVRFLGLDVHAETIAVAIAEQDGEVRSLGIIPNLSAIEAEEPSVGDGNRVRVASQILQHMLGLAERRLGVDHPLCSAQGTEQRVKGTWCG